MHLSLYVSTTFPFSHGSVYMCTWKAAIHLCSLTRSSLSIISEKKKEISAWYSLYLLCSSVVLLCCLVIAHLLFYIKSIYFPHAVMNAIKYMQSNVLWKSKKFKTEKWFINISGKSLLPWSLSRLACRFLLHCIQCQIVRVNINDVFLVFYIF